MRTADSLALALILTLCGIVFSATITRTADQTRELALLRARVAKLEADALSHQRTLAGDAWPVDWRANDPVLVLPLTLNP